MNFMIDLATKFYDCQRAFYDCGTAFGDYQRAFWVQTNKYEKGSAAATIALSAMAAYICKYVADNVKCWDFISKLSAMTIRLREVPLSTAKASIAVNFAMLLYAQHLKGRVHTWQVIGLVVVITYLVTSIIKGYEILHPCVQCKPRFQRRRSIQKSPSAPASL
jgi:hypothetical protein